MDAVPDLLTLCLRLQAIVTGLRQSVKGFQNSVTGVTPQDVLELMLVTQYYDMLREVSRCFGLGCRHNCPQ
jgi:hypothetical protein